MKWHTASFSDIERELATDFHAGLPFQEANARLLQYGPNELPEGKRERLISIFLRQFKSSLIYVLLGASVIVFFTGDVTDSAIIFFILLFNAAVGTIQEGRAQNTLRALKKFSQANAVVRRGAGEMILADREIVPGDVILLHEGEKIPADARLIETRMLRVDEAILTGESVPVDKREGTLKNEHAQITEMANMVFKGTHVVYGSGRAVVTATGMQTVIGEISEKVAVIDTEIPLARDIRHLARLIVAVVLAVTGILFVIGIAAEKSAQEMFTTIVALSVSLIPEGLPIVLTLVLATGAWRMAKRNALVKRFQAVEALGQAKIIAVDKTGTITRNELVVREVYAAGETFGVGGTGYEPNGEIRHEGNVVDPPNHPELLLAGKIAAFSSSANIAFREDTKTWNVLGDPTEAAMTVFAAKVGFHKEDLEEEMPFLGEVPFDYKTKYHVTSHAEDGKQFIAVSGAPEAVLGLADFIFTGAQKEPLSPKKREELEKVVHRMSERGLRVVAYALDEAPLPRENRVLERIEIRNLVFAGFCGMEDSLRPEVPQAMEAARQAGIKVVMITGDHKLTAVAIAKEAGIWNAGEKVLLGDEIDAMSEEELMRELNAVSVFARVTPDHKLKIIQAYRRRGEVVAMTGDGVNDAPPLVAADLGVAMGKIGSEVTKEAADIVLLDDNFGTIVSAIEEGRSIYRTIKKVVLYLFSTSIGELLTIGGAIVLGYPLPILPAQILWLNLVTDGFLDVALAMEPKDKNLLEGGFVRPTRYLVDTRMGVRMAAMALPMMGGTLYLFSQLYENDIAKAWTIALTTLAIFQWFNAWNCRSEDKSIFQMNPFSNKFLVAATAIVIMLQVWALTSPFMQGILRTVPLTMYEWLWCALIASSILVFEEARKALVRRRE